MKFRWLLRRVAGEQARQHGESRLGRCMAMAKALAMARSNRAYIHALRRLPIVAPQLSELEVGEKADQYRGMEYSRDLKRRQRRILVAHGYKATA